MREILFRGKTKRGTWVEGYLVDGKWCMDGSRRTCIIPLDVIFYPGCEISGWEDVIPETVGQFTGLFDKHGKKIFEGDIVKCSIIYDIGCYPHSKIEIRKVEYIEGCFWPFYNCERNAYEIIGNIHDNPDLLRG